jgi:hypothetical protein
MESLVYEDSPLADYLEGMEGLGNNCLEQKTDTVGRFR